MEQHREDFSDSTPKFVVNTTHVYFSTQLIRDKLHSGTFPWSNLLKRLSTYSSSCWKIIKAFETFQKCTYTLGLIHMFWFLENTIKYNKYNTKTKTWCCHGNIPCIYDCFGSVSLTNSTWSDSKFVWWEMFIYLANLWSVSSDLQQCW
jgi:hypothetical protein